jgi:hypothetical protein
MKDGEVPPTRIDILLDMELFWRNRKVYPSCPKPAKTGYIYEEPVFTQKARSKY